MTDIESVAGRSWKAVELFETRRFSLSYFYLQRVRVNLFTETVFVRHFAAHLIFILQVGSAADAPTSVQIVAHQTLTGIPVSC